MATYIRELLDLPSQVDKGDFVLNLTAGVSARNASDTLRNYVVTPQLTACFEHALRFIKNGVDANQSKACYLHGSFGSGKSHFMAVLHLLLQNNPEARSIKRTGRPSSPSTTSWTQGRKFLLVPFHMIGSRSMEQGILGQYANYVRRLHPDGADSRVCTWRRACSRTPRAFANGTWAMRGLLPASSTRTSGRGNGGGWGSICRRLGRRELSTPPMAAEPGNSRTHPAGW